MRVNVSRESLRDHMLSKTVLKCSVMLEDAPVFKYPILFYTLCINTRVFLCQTTKIQKYDHIQRHLKSCVGDFISMNHIPMQ